MKRSDSETRSPSGTDDSASSGQGGKGPIRFLSSRGSSKRVSPAEDPAAQTASPWAAALEKQKSRALPDKAAFGGHGGGLKNIISSYLGASRMRRRRVAQDDDARFADQSYDRHWEIRLAASGPWTAFLILLSCLLSLTGIMILDYVNWSRMWTEFGLVIFVGGIWAFDLWLQQRAWEQARVTCATALTRKILKGLDIFSVLWCFCGAFFIFVCGGYYFDGFKTGSWSGGMESPTVLSIDGAKNYLVLGTHMIHIYATVVKAAFMIKAVGAIQRYRVWCLHFCEGELRKDPASPNVVSHAAFFMHTLTVLVVFMVCGWFFPHLGSGGLLDNAGFEILAVLEAFVGPDGAIEDRSGLESFLDVYGADRGGRLVMLSNVGWELMRVSVGAGENQELYVVGHDHLHFEESNMKIIVRSENHMAEAYFALNGVRPDMIGPIVGWHVLFIVTVLGISVLVTAGLIKHILLPLNLMYETLMQSASMLEETGLLGERELKADSEADAHSADVAMQKVARAVMLLARAARSGGRGMIQRLIQSTGGSEERQLAEQWVRLYEGGPTAYERPSENGTAGRKTSGIGQRISHQHEGASSSPRTRRKSVPGLAGTVSVAANGEAREVGRRKTGRYDRKLRPSEAEAGLAADAAAAVVASARDSGIPDAPGVVSKAPVIPADLWHPGAADMGNFSWNVLQHDEQDNVKLVLMMFDQLDLIVPKPGGLVSLPVLEAFVRAVADTYADHPYHNWWHAVDVTHNVFVILQQCAAIKGGIPAVEKFALMIAAIAHDAGHKGVNNAFLTKTDDPLSIFYNDQSIQEHLSASIVFQLNKEPATAVFGKLTRAQFMRAKKVVVHAILMTDMAQHFSLTSKVAVLAEVVSSDCAHEKPSNASCLGEASCFAKKLIADVDTRDTTLAAVLHAADILHACKPWDLEMDWGMRALEELFAQGDRETDMGLPVDPIMRRDGQGPEESQMGFMDFVLAPFTKALADLLPELREAALVPMVDNYAAWAAAAIARLQEKNPEGDSKKAQQLREKIELFEDKYLPADAQLEAEEELKAEASIENAARPKQSTIVNAFQRVRQSLQIDRPSMDRGGARLAPTSSMRARQRGLLKTPSMTRKSPSGATAAPARMSLQLPRSRLGSQPPQGASKAEEPPSAPQRNGVANVEAIMSNLLSSTGSARRLNVRQDPPPAGSTGWTREEFPSRTLETIGEAGQ
ncbi:unnamed protein product [Pedinophyceae sp. YPF-701]|nr:unnamed protein product [Pedinophyceae sp. YPF-701]